VFVRCILCEYPFFLNAYAVDDVDSLVEDWVVAKYQHPEYRSWSEALPTVRKQMARTQALKQGSSKRVSELLTGRERTYLAYMPSAT
jgi:hypothetical protein